MDAIRSARRRRGVSQRRLADRAGLSFRGVQLLESAGHDPRLSSLVRVAAALGLPSEGIARLVADFFREPASSFRSASIRMARDGFASWPLHLFDAVDRYRQSGDQDLISAPPMLPLDARLEALIASTVESLCHEATLDAPSWCRAVVSLDRPWFVSGVENLKASALVGSRTSWRGCERAHVRANTIDARRPQRGAPRARRHR
jgi:transcriptional regulator with XRE-family HTH domain